MTTIGEKFVERGEMDRYQQDCLRTWRQWPHGLNLTSEQAQILNAALGLGESGETQDAVKKWIFQGHELDVDGIVKELGDQMFYVSVLARALNIDLSLVARKNTAKLRERFPDGFSEEASVNRVEAVG